MLSIVFPMAAYAQTAQDGPARVLVLYENDPTLPAAMEIAQGIRASLLETGPPKLELFSDYMDTIRFEGAAHLAVLTRYLQEKYRDVRFDVVMATGPGALKFALSHREIFGEKTPIVFGAVTDTSAEGMALPPDVKGIVSHFDVRKTMDLAITLQPDARQIVVMTGSADFDKRWQVSTREALADSYAGVRVSYLSGLSIDGFKAAAAKLASNTIVLIPTLFEDANGRRFVPREAVEMVVKSSNAPIYAVYSSYLGTGVVGGFVGTFHEVGIEMGSLTSDILRGDLSAPQTRQVKDGPLVDWRQIVRWGIDPKRIPDNAEIQNREPSAWDRYRVEIVAAAIVFLILVSTIVILFFQHRRRLRLEADLKLERLELAYLSRSTQLGELSGALAHELNQPLTSILANAEAGSRLLDIEPVDLPEMREIMKDIVFDNKRAATVITQLRRLLLKGETTLERMDLNHAVATTISLARSELLARQTHVDVMLDMPAVPVLANLPQLQQVILNLVLNAADAMAHLPPNRREIAVQTRKRQNGICELTVTDRGKGVSAEQRVEIFKPFVSTKQASLGLGLSICRSIAKAHGGTLRFDEDFVGGARAIFTLHSA
jgi:signal transduction histidine kinase